MREILFRGKTAKGEWVEGFYCNCVKAVGMKKIPSIQQTDDNSLYFREIIPETVGQFTGLTDKKGKKIFEGDIVLYYDPYNDGEDIQKIGFFECDERFVNFRIHGTQMIPFFCEVIGNIYDNPEFLGE